jgi:hypothetical protein
MRFVRIPATFGAVALVFSSFTVAPTRARANDIPVAVGSRAVVPVSLATAVSFTTTRWATGMGEHSWLCSVGLRDEHAGLGGDIAWSAKHVWGEHEGKNGWRRHDDDGEDDDDGHRQTPVPEPSTGFLVFSGIAALAGWRLRRHAMAKVG